MKNLNKLVHLFLQSLEPLEDKNVVIGYSGGADSTALLHLLKDKQEFFSFNLKAVFFSHEGSPLIENEDVLIKHCKEFCSLINVDLIIHPLHLEKQKNQSWESSGRMGRMSFYENNPSDYVFLGHHKDDQDETTMIQLFRGAGKGISAMKKIENFYCRPFLDIHKEDIYKHLEHKKLTWIEDSTNTNVEFTRNFWRLEGLPTIKKYYPHYSQQLDLLREKTTELIQMSKELAKVDGLETLLSGNSLNIENLNDLRLKNLISQFYSSYKISIEKPYVENQINEYRLKNNTVLEKKEVTVVLDSGTLNVKKIENTPLKKSVKRL